MPLCTHRVPFPCRPVAYAVGTLCWGLLPLPLPALAADQGGTKTLDTVEIHGHFENAVGTSDAASQGVVRGEMLKDIPLLRPGEALETVPGMVVTQHSGDGKANQYFLRGYNLDHGIDFATTLNGIPANMPTNAHGQGYSDVNGLIPELVERIAYRKGPYFAENGDMSSAGSAEIHYRSRLAQDMVDLTTGTYGYRRVLLAGSRPLGLPGGAADLGSAPQLLGAVEVLHNDGPWTTPQKLEKTNAFLRLSDGGAGAGWRVDGGYYDARWNATDQVPLEMIEAGTLGRYSAVDPYDGGTAGRVSLAGEWHRSDESGYRRISAYAQHSRLQLWSNFTLFENDPLRGDQILQAEQRNLLGLQAVQGWNHSLLGNDAVSELGLQFRHDHVNVSTRLSEARVPYQTLSDDRVNLAALGIYGQTTLNWFPWLRQTLGLRVEHQRMDLSSRVQPENQGASQGTKLLPKLSLVLGPWARTEFFFNAGKGFHSNDARGVLYRVAPDGSPADAAPVLVSSSGKEVGVRSEIIPGLQSSLAVWSLNSDSEILYSADAGNTEPHGASRRYGLEWNNHWTPVPWFLLDVDLAWSHSRFVSANDGGEAGNLIPNGVSRVGMVRASVHDLGPWSLGLETRYIGGYPLTQDGSLRTPAALVTNLRLQRAFTRDVSLSWDLLNAFNRPYYDIAYAQDYRTSPSSAVVPTGITVHPGEPRELRMTVHLRF